MTRSAASPDISRAERRGMVALCAVFALIVQILAPAFASAAPRLPDGSMLICADGAGKAPIGLPGAPGVDDHPCDHCVCPPPLFTPATTSAVQRVAYSQTTATPSPPPRFRTPPARAPPRPPGQGPPTSDA
ncbi:MAG: DUF2946 family protein [Pseudomonadota bacterium]